MTCAWRVRVTWRWGGRSFTQYVWADSSFRSCRSFCSPFQLIWHDTANIWSLLLCCLLSQAFSLWCFSGTNGYIIIIIIIIIVIIIIINIIIIITITFMQGIYDYIPETNHFARVCSVVAVLYLQFVLHIMLFCPWNMFFTFTLALSILCVQCPIGCFFISLISLFPGMLPRYCMSDFEMVPVAPIITVSLLHSDSTCAEFVLLGLHILKSSQLLPWYHFCLQDLQHLLSCIFIV